jgi:Ser/Thr protein kinase RdoA (MazF antagonist)
MHAPPKLVLGRYPAAARPASPPEALGNAGGASGARLWRFASGLGRLALRAWPADGPDRATLERVHLWIDEAKGVGFLPVPIRGLDGRTVQEAGGTLWELAPWLPGSADLSRPPAPGRLRAGFAGLAAFHQRLAHHGASGPSPGLGRRLQEARDLLAGGFRELEGRLSSAPADPRRELARRWCASARPLAPEVGEALCKAADAPISCQPCLRDARPDHFLFAGDRLTGLVDFGAMGIESVAADLARLLAEWVGPDRASRAEALAAYAAVRPLEARETALIDVFERSAALLGGGHWVRWHFVEGRTFDDPEAVLHGLEKGLERLASLAGDP